MTSVPAAAGGIAGSDEARIARQTALIVAALVCLRLGGAVLLPLTCDEAYYWVWSQHLAAGYYDHPPMVAFVIRLGTLMAGHTELGVRLISILLALPTSWAIYRTTSILFGSAPASSTATILFNATMMVTVGTMTASPDAPLMLACSLVLLALAKVLETGRGAWWLGVGAAVGLALVSKYNALFLGLSILIWLAVVPSLRHWLISPWPYLGALLTLLVFLPTLIWNADHGWSSFVLQFGRMHVGEFKLRYLAELYGGQILMATPAVYILGIGGLYALMKDHTGGRGAAWLILAGVLPIAVYFTFHALHGGVHPNWLAPVYPAFAIAAAVAANLVAWSGRWRRIMDFLARWALPTSVAMFALMIIQVNTGTLTGYRKDQGAQLFAVGIRPLADELEKIRRQVGASCILLSDFGTTAWLAFYLPETCVAQRGEKIRWGDRPPLTPAQLESKLLFVDVDLPLHNYHLERSFRTSQLLTRLERKRGPTVIQHYDVVIGEGVLEDVQDWKPLPTDD